MAHLIPYPFGRLLRRAVRELEQNGSIFDLPARKFFTGSAGRDFSVSLHGRLISSPLGPAAGPHTQMAQNIVLSWLAGARYMELKTVQVLDELVIPRPCIDVTTIGYNAEWSQELRVGDALAEYVKGMMLIEILKQGGYVPCRPGFGDTFFDMSLGYDLAGISGDTVRGFVAGMRNVRPWIEAFRREIPDELARLRDIDYPANLSESVTLSTFHGCPPDEIERIIYFLLEEERLNCVVKLNPMLLGSPETHRLLHDVMGYRKLRAPQAAFDRDIPWGRAVEMVGRLNAKAASLGLSFGVKFSNTLVVDNTSGMIPADTGEIYLSGAPLHVLAVNLVGRFRQELGDTVPVSFSAGIDRFNFPDAVALGLLPITVCTDLLRTGGYGRLPAYYRELERRMAVVGAATPDDFVIRAFGQGEAALAGLGFAAGDPALARCRAALEQGGDLKAAAGTDLYARWVSGARLRNTEDYVPRATADPRYAEPRNRTPPNKIGRHLVLFDCISCDKCVPVCPNDANFTFRPTEREFSIVKIRPAADGWEWRREGTVTLREDHQIGTFADFCNECGNCDVFCPEDGGPYLVKPRFFGSEAVFRESRTLDGFYVEQHPGGDRILGRAAGVEYSLERTPDQVTFSGDGFLVRFRETDPEGTLEARGQGEIDMTWCAIMNTIRDGALDAALTSYVNTF
jgi:putative selenate reductase